MLVRRVTCEKHERLRSGNVILSATQSETEEMSAYFAENCL